MNPCPCGSKKDYLACCSAYITEKAIPKTPEALMRSRYTAYTLGDIAYIKKTMRGKPLAGFDEQETALWAKRVLWLNLQVINTHLDAQDEHLGFVEFIASYLDKNTVKTIHEQSQFQCLDGHWFYVDGHHAKLNPSQPTRSIPRNAPCPCGSGKKFKNCHAKD